MINPGIHSRARAGIKGWEQQEVFGKLGKPEWDFLEQDLPTGSYSLLAIPKNILADAVPAAPRKYPRDFPLHFLKLLLSCLWLFPRIPQGYKDVQTGGCWVWCLALEQDLGWESLPRRAGKQREMGF